MSLFFKGDVLNILKTKIESKSINLVYIDPPFGTTKNFWDESMDWSKLFTEFFRILKDDGMLVIHCSVPFNYQLIKEAPKAPSHSWYWIKDSHTNPLISNYQPLRQVEEILVWKNKKSVYYPQKIGDELQKSTYMTKADYFGQNKKEKITYNKGKFRSNFIFIKRKLDGFSTRPAELVKLMIDSYSKENDVILDCFCYKGLSYTMKGNRKWIGIDKYFMPNYFINKKEN